MSQTLRSRVLRFGTDGQPEELTDELAVEEPLEIRIGSQPLSVTMRTPGNDVELTAGLLLSEGIFPRDTRPLLRQEGPNVVNVAAQGSVAAALSRLQRISPVSASCGVCGKSSIEAVYRDLPPLNDQATIARSALSGIIESLSASQPAFSRTGGLHAAGVFSLSGEAIVVREDIGRHNAVDKCVGHALLRGLLPLSARVLAVSGRVSFEIVQKALAAGVPILAAVSAPSSLAVELAEQMGLTLAGFVRSGRCNVYTHGDRVLF